MAVIEVKNFAISFNGRSVHKNVSFKVEKGECLGLIGGSGVGKSVVLRSLIGLEKPDSGEIWIEGEEISKWKERQLIPIRKKVAYVFQNGALFDSISVHANLAYPLREHTKMTEQQINRRIVEQLKEFGLQDSEHKFPSQLSGGMQKRLGLARSIIIGPNVVLYDEPTAGLDPYNTLKIQEMALQMKKKGVTSVIVTHDMPTAMAVCDRFCLLMGGEVKASGRIDEVEDVRLLQQFMKGEVG